jgi:predicted tellurium resistance membrane protein TerC
MPFDQVFELHDLAIVGLLVVLEGVLSIDNALVLGLLAKRLPKREQARALTYGLVGAFAFRLISIATAQLLLRFRIVKLIGGLYLFYVAIKYFWDEWRERAAKEKPSEDGQASVDPGEIRRAGFWSTVLVI